MPRSLFALTFLAASWAAHAEAPFESLFIGIGASSLRSTEIGLGSRRVESSPVAFLGPSVYLKGRIPNTLILHDERGLPRAASFDILFPGMLIFAGYYEGGRWMLLGLLNGEIGARLGGVEIGIVNGIHPFFTRSSPYHEAGVRIGFGKVHNWGVTVYEQDRLGPPARFGIRFDGQFHSEVAR